MVDGDPICNITGRCEPVSPDAGISCCKHCGAELHRVEGEWVHWSNSKSLYNQPYIPGLHPPTGYLYEELTEGYDIQSGDHNGRFRSWDHRFSRDAPAPGRTVRNVKPVWSNPVLIDG
jgi:hypothetical protein